MVFRKKSRVKDLKSVISHLTEESDKLKRDLARAKNIIKLQGEMLENATLRMKESGLKRPATARTREMIDKPA